MGNGALRNPAIAEVTETLGLDDVFASTAMALVYVLLAMNLTACTYRRVIRRRRRKTVLPRPPEDAYVVEMANADEAREAVGRARGARAADVGEARTRRWREWLRRRRRGSRVRRVDRHARSG